MLDRIQNGRTDLVFEYVAAGNSVDTADADGVSLIQWCAYYGDVSAIRFLVASGAQLASLGDNLDLNGAAFHGHWRLCEYLIENGADANHPLPDTLETPLHATLAAANRPSHDLVAQVLLAAGADPNARTKPGVETGSFMRDCRTKGETPLHRAAAFGSVFVIKRLLAAGATVDARDANGETPLAWASWHLRPDTVLRLLCYGPYRIRPDRDEAREHGPGWGAMDLFLLGKPRQ